jgi:hypothetical protein
MQPPEILAAWRDELAAELDAARVAFEGAEAEVLAAFTAASLARAERAGLAAALARLPAETRLAAALASKVHEHQDGIALADGRLACARAALKNAQLALADVTSALDQVSLIAPPEIEEAA